jgi:hypothetical protein
VACGAIATIIRWRRSWRVVIVAALLGGVIVAGSYAGAALASDPPGNYVSTVRIQSKWVHDIDSYHNPHRAPLSSLMPLFFYRPVAANVVQIVSILAALGIIAGLIVRRGPALLVLATFLPFAIFAWMMLDGAAASRYAIGYMPLHALFAVEALSVAGRPLRGRGWVEELVPQIGSIILAASLAWWTWPAAKRVRSADAPPVAAARWILHNTYPGAGTIFVHNGVGPFAEYFLAGYEQRYFENAGDVPYSGYTEPAFIFTPLAVKAGDAQVFVQPHDRLWRIVRQRYFEAAVLPAWDLVRFGAGWHDAESNGDETWRWMAKSSQTLLPTAGARGKLTLRLYVPVDSLPSPPAVDVEFNGALVERFVAAKPDIEKTWVLPSRQGAANELRITTSETIVPARAHPGGDTRELGLKLLAITWQPASQ